MPHPPSARRDTVLGAFETPVPPDRATTAWPVAPAGSPERSPQPAAAPVAGLRGAAEVGEARGKGVAVLPVLDDDTEATPPTAAPGAFRFNFEWNDLPETAASARDAGPAPEQIQAPDDAVQGLTHDAAITLNDDEDVSPAVVVERVVPVCVERVPSVPPAVVRASEAPTAVPRASAARASLQRTATSAPVRGPSAGPAVASMQWLVFGAGAGALVVGVVSWAFGAL